jgi:YesN/AraC family two-component response regulator
MIEYVRNHCREKLTAASVAQAFHYHPNYVSRLFLRHTGQPLHRYLIGCRIELAQQLLSSTACSAAQIAEMTGFSSPADFSRTFRRTLGCAPSDFRS